MVHPKSVHRCTNTGTGGRRDTQGSLQMLYKQELEFPGTEHGSILAALCIYSEICEQYFGSF